MFFSTFSYPSHLKHLLLRAFLEDGLPEMLSKVGVLAERGIKKSKKHHAIAPIATTPRKVPGRENSDCENTMKMKIHFEKHQHLLVFVDVCVTELLFLQFFTMIMDAFFLNSCSKAAPAALGGCGCLGQLWEALAELWEALGELWEGLCKNSRSTAPADVMLNIYLHYRISLHIHCSIFVVGSWHTPPWVGAAGYVWPAQGAPWASSLAGWVR